MRKGICLIATGVLCLSFIIPKYNSGSNPVNGIPPYLYLSSKWADSILQTMTPDERLGQLFMVPAYSRADSAQAKVMNLIQDFHIGGLIFMQGSPGRQVALTNYFQQLSKVPLMISQDAEWGLSMRLDSVIRFPRQLTLGAIQDDSLIYEFGKEMARECRRIGITVSFSPVVDINSNPLNPVIGDRSFGEDKFNVSAKGIAYMKGLQDGGVLACAKHFPGHGDTDQDSHKTLPVVNSPRSRLDSTELYPFRQLINAGVGSVMVAHLDIPALDTTSGLPSSLSKKVVTGLLKVEMGFKGLSFTDALNMKGVSNYSTPGEIDLHALLAGNDVLLFSGDVPATITQIKDAMVRGDITQDEIDARVRKILQAKYWLGLNKWVPLKTTNIYEDLNSNEALYLKQRLSEEALTLVRNENDFIPLRRIDSTRIASVAIGAQETTPFQEMLSNYAGVKHFQIKKDASGRDFDKLEVVLKNYDVVIVSIQNMSRYPANGFGLTDNTKSFVSKLTPRPGVVVTVFGSPYALKFFENAKCLVEAYNDEEITQQLAAQLLFGGITAKGKLPVNVSAIIPIGRGITTSTQLRLKYTMPEEVNISTKKMKVIDSLVDEAITEHATPGCQVWVAKDGKVIWQKSYGNRTTDFSSEVRNNDLYDVASITKIAATTMMLMKLYQQDKLNLDKTIGDYLPEFKGTNKEHIKIHQLLTHEAGLVPYIPFYKKTLDSAGNLDADVYSRMKHAPYTVEVTPDIFMNRHYIDTMWTAITRSAVTPSPKYVYSDNDFYFLKRIAETIAGESLDQYVRKNFYDPLGLADMCFKPLDTIPIDRIVPSNYDFFWRKEVIRGTVHDQGAAMMGGVAGHAGLFSDANDLGTLMQMVLNMGAYAGQSYLDSATVRRFTARNSLSCRRGLGFDKPETEPGKASPACESASPAAYGHQGFTGTCVWVDPRYQLVYVFLSNRTFPDDENKKLNTLDTRIKIQQAIYDAFLKPN
jgi:beta-N-acetylhexosaminidase